MSDDNPTPRRIAAEIALYVLLVLVVGAAFVAVRVARNGPRVLSFDPHAGAAPEDESAGEAGTGERR